MKHKPFKRLGALVLAGAMLLGVLPALTGEPVVPAAAAVETAAGLSVAFADKDFAVGKAIGLDVEGASGNVSYQWKVDGTTVGTSATYTPKEADLAKWITVTVTAGGDSVEAKMFFSKLPVLYIDTEGGQAITSKEKYIDANLRVQGTDTFNADDYKLYDGLTEIRGRGNSTWGQPKKPYRLKLDKKTDMFGMGKSKHWVLLANYMDESLQRNTLAYNLSASMGMEHCSTVFVDVVLNGDFVGNYQFCENIRVDPNRVDIFDWETFCEDVAAVIIDTEGLDDDTAGDLEDAMAEDMAWITSGSVSLNGKTYKIQDYDVEVPNITGGYLIELDAYFDEISKFDTASGQPIMFKNPEYVVTNDDMFNYVKDYIQAFEDAVESADYTSQYEGETVHYSDMYDMDALVDYWLISEIFFNEEINKKSTYMHKEIDEKMKMGPIWDMDYSSGGEGQTYRTENWATLYFNSGEHSSSQTRNWYKYLIKDPYFFMKAQERYWVIRGDHVEAMLDEIDVNYDLLKESAAANGKRWGYGSSFDSYVNSLRNWFNTHLTWLDKQMATQDALRDSLGYHSSSRLAMTLSDSKGAALAADTAAKAPADGAIVTGQGVKVSIQCGSSTDGTAVLYVNGREIGRTASTANKTLTLDIPAQKLTAEPGEKNVIEVKIIQADGAVNGSRYVTVLETLAAKPAQKDMGRNIAQ